MKKEKETTQAHHPTTRPPEQLIRLDWALRYLLKDKVDYKILEGFLSELFKKDVTVVDVLESESNKTHEQDKYNRVDLLVKTKEDEHIVVEFQASSEHDYFSRIIYGGSKVLVENLYAGDGYMEVKKVIGVSIMYCNVGESEDYIRHGKMQFLGYHDKKPVMLSASEKENIYGAKGYASPDDICPEYYIISLPKFDKNVKDRLDEWIYFLKTTTIQPSFKAKGLEKAKKRFSRISLNAEERWEYDAFLKNEGHQKSTWLTNRNDGKAERDRELVLSMHENGMPITDIAKWLKLNVEKVTQILTAAKQVTKK